MLTRPHGAPNTAHSDTAIPTRPAPTQPASPSSSAAGSPIRSKWAPSSQARRPCAAGSCSRSAAPRTNGCVELGAGTGVISRALLDGRHPARSPHRRRRDRPRHGPPPRRHPARGRPSSKATPASLPSLLPRAWHGRIGTVVCGIPLVLLPLAQQRRFIDAMQAVAPGRGFLHYSYCVTSPLPARKHGLIARREAWTPLNFPPASVWRYDARLTRNRRRTCHAGGNHRSLRQRAWHSPVAQVSDTHLGARTQLFRTNFDRVVQAIEDLHGPTSWSRPAASFARRRRPGCRHGPRGRPVRPHRPPPSTPSPATTTSATTRSAPPASPSTMTAWTASAAPWAATAGSSTTATGACSASTARSWAPTPPRPPRPASSRTRSPPSATDASPSSSTSPSSPPTPMRRCSTTGPSPLRPRTPAPPARSPQPPPRRIGPPAPPPRDHPRPRPLRLGPLGRLRRGPAGPARPSRRAPHRLPAAQLR